MKSFKTFLEEFGSAGPANVVGSGAIAGTGEKGGEPGVKRRKAVIIQPMQKRVAPRS